MSPTLPERFRALHVPGTPLLCPNPWDAGSAKVLAGLGFEALATTSSGFAATLGRLDGDVSGEEALANAATIAAAVDVPVMADFENGYDDPAATAAAAVDAGLAGWSIEDWDGAAIYPFDEAVERVAAAVAANAGRLVLTARAENLLRNAGDLDDTIARLQAFAAAGADVVYAPRLESLGDIRAVVAAVDVPVNVLALPAVPPVAELAAAGVARVTVGGGLHWTALGALADAAEELRDRGTYGLWDRARPFRDA